MQRPVTDGFIDERAGDQPVDERLTRAARAARALSEALWDALHEELDASRRPPSRDLAAEISARLADVAGSIALLARLGAPSAFTHERAASVKGGTAGAVGGGTAGPVVGDTAERERESRGWPESEGGQAGPVDALASGHTRARVQPFSKGFSPPSPPSRATPPSMGQPPPEPAVDLPAPTTAATGMAVVVDEWAPAPAQPRPAAASDAAVGSPGEPPSAVAKDVWPGPSDALAAQTPTAPPEIEIRDERHEHAHREEAFPQERSRNQWIASIERRLERYERDQLPFAVMLVELVDVGRLRHAELPGEVARITGLVETALAKELRPADSLTRESPGRYWLLAPETDTAGARTLAGRLSQAVRSAAGHRGAPLELAVGIAACPRDGSQAAALAAHADIALYAARAAGRQIAP